MIFKLKENFEGSPWYGDSMMEKIESIDYKNVNNCTATFTNSVAKLIQHVINSFARGSSDRIHWLGRFGHTDWRRHPPQSLKGVSHVLVPHAG